MFDETTELKTIIIEPDQTAFTKTTRIRNDTKKTIAIQHQCIKNAMMENINIVGIVTK